MLATILISDVCSQNLLLLHAHLLCTQLLSTGSYEIILPDLGNFTEEEQVLLKDLEADYPHFTVLREKTLNRSVLLNQAALKARGKWLIFTESHCIMRKDWLQKYLSFLETANVPVVRGKIKDLPNGSWIGKTEEILRNKIEATRKQEKKTDFYLDFHHTAILKDLFLSTGKLDTNLPILAEFELGARFHEKGYPIHEWEGSLVWHKNDTTLSGYMKIVRQNGKDMMRVFLTQGARFATKYFPNSVFRHISAARYISAPLLFISNVLNIFGSLGCKVLQALKWRKAYNHLFSLYGKNTHRTGLLDEYRNYRRSLKYSLIKKVKGKAVRFLQNVLFISPKMPEHVNIEISTACNLKCKMCKRETIDFGNKLMPYATFTRIIDRLPNEVKLLSFGGYGEMLLHPKFFEMVAYAKSKGFSTQTTSNGTLLSDDARMNKLLDSGLDEFRISIDRIVPPSESGEEIGHVFSEKLLKILSRLSSLRKEKESKIILGINTVVHHNNIDEIIPIIEFAEGLDLDLVDLIRLDTCANKASRLLLFEKEKELYKSIDRLPKKIKVTTPLNRFAGIRKMYHLRKEYCPFRLKGAHIRMNGAVTPCGFGFATHDFGNILETDLKKIWNTDLFRTTRNNDQNPVCKSCSIFKWKPLNRNC